MPIRINFLAEQQEAEEMRRRDPLKRAMFGAGAIVAVGVIACGVFQMKVSSAQAALQAKKDELANIEKVSKIVGDNFKKVGEMEEKMKSLNELAVNRPLWGPVLNSLQMALADLTPKTPGANCPITLLGFRVAQRYDYVEGKKATPTAKGKPSTTTEKINFVLQGRDYGAEQDQNYNLLKERLASDPVLKDLLRKENPVRLLNFSERQMDPSDPTRNFVTFSLECNYPEKVR
jgi:hypothetical protein